MKPDREELAGRLADIPAAFIDDHLQRLGDEYFADFSTAEVTGHIRELSTLSAQRPAVAVVESDDGRGLTCTVLGFDYAAAFSLITGLLAASGMAIDAGAAYTYAPRAGSSGGAHRPRRGRPRRPRLDPARAGGRRRIIDRFRGRRVDAHARALSLEAWAQLLGERLLQVALDLEAGSLEQARRRVSELVAETIRAGSSSQPTLFPVDIEVAQVAAGSGHPAVTRLHIVSQDTPLFLYSFSAALSLRGVSIQRVSIRTRAGRVEDTVDLLGRGGQPITDETLLDQLRLSVLLTKQFAYFVGAAPDPYAALLRFEQLTEEVLALPEHGNLVDLLANPRVLGELALLLGTSDYLWEDFIRRQFDTLLPMLELDDGERPIDGPEQEVGARLRAAVAAVPPDQRVAELNRFKDHEAFLIDLYHILRPGHGVRDLSGKLTELAESVIAVAVELAEEHLRPRFGAPATFGGIGTRLAVLGLGKLGGRALGYASDIELMFLFNDQGQTSGPEQINAGEYYVRLVRETERRIEAKSEGIFEVDLRLRPYGASGRHAVSLDSFSKYYGPGGEALAYERLALLRLRTVAGDRALGARVERLRDQFVYEAGLIDLQEVHDMRRRQVDEYDAEARLNAKFSPGALVDVEYSVQMLQVRYGERDQQLRTASVHEALAALTRAGILEQTEADHLVDAYDFFRQLINGLRILRGSARDLYLPDVQALEYGHLARRMGYRDSDGLTPAQQLHLDLETYRAEVRQFITTHLGSGSLSSGSVAGIADLLYDTAADTERNPLPVLRRHGFADPPRALANLRRLAEGVEDRNTFARLAVLAVDILATLADPDRALNNWERYVAALRDRGEHYQVMLRQPTQLELLLRIFTTSQFLADALVRTPSLFDWIADSERLSGARSLYAVSAELAAAAASVSSHDDWLRELRLVRRREVLRIAIRDYCLGAPVTDVMRELSTVAEACIDAALRRLVDVSASGAQAQGNQLGWRAHDFLQRTCILALGKLGAIELNYSSDIDLVAIYDDRGLHEAERSRLAQKLAAVSRGVQDILAAYTAETAAYRVDWRLRPYGGSGELAHSFSGLLDYYAGPAGDWEVQALLRMRPVAGNRALGSQLLEASRDAFTRFGSAPEQRRKAVFASIERMRELALEQGSSLRRGVDIKNGAGGLRDVEFLVQGLQLTYLEQHPQLLVGNTVSALERLERCGILAADTAARLREDYLFLRRLEHSLQVFEDRQVHALPTDAEALDALARRMLGTDADRATLERTLERVTTRVRAGFVETVAAARADSAAAAGSDARSGASPAPSGER